MYNKHGKTIKRNGKRILVRKGVRLEANKVKVVKINGKKFYKVGKSTYIKFRNAKTLPQTGEKKTTAGIFGLALAGIASLLGLAGDRKRKNN